MGYNYEAEERAAFNREYNATGGEYGPLGRRGGYLPFGVGIPYGVGGALSAGVVGIHTKGFNAVLPVAGVVGLAESIVGAHPSQPYTTYNSYPPAPGVVPGYGAGSVGASFAPMNAGGPENQLVDLLIQANRDPVNAQQYLGQARAITSSLQQSSPDGQIHLQGTVRRNIDGQNIQLNFTDRHAATSDYTSFDAMATDIAKYAHLNNIRNELGQRAPVGPAMGAPVTQPLSVSATPPATVPVTAAPATQPSTAAPATPPVVGGAAPSTPDQPQTGGHAHPHHKGHATHTPAISAEQKALNQEGQAILEGLGEHTGGKNDQAYKTASQAERAHQMDGAVGARTEQAMHDVGFKDFHKGDSITQAEIDALKKIANPQQPVHQPAAATPAAPAVNAPSAAATTTPATKTAAAPSAAPTTAQVQAASQMLLTNAPNDPLTAGIVSHMQAAAAPATVASAIPPVAATTAVTPPTVTAPAVKVVPVQPPAALFGGQTFTNTETAQATPAPQQPTVQPAIYTTTTAIAHDQEQIALATSGNLSAPNTPASARPINIGGNARNA